jgi:competence ComEA-like helix-hairpin-helix protein
MKKGTNLLLLVSVASLFLVIGIFVGRSTKNEMVTLSENENSVLFTNTTATEPKADYRLDINTATKRQLMELPGIGEILADRIIAFRTENGSFVTIDDLLDIEGIGEKKLEEMKDLIRTGG